LSDERLADLPASLERLGCCATNVTTGGLSRPFGAELRAST